MNLFYKESGYADCLGFVECGDVLYCLLLFCGGFGATNFSLEEEMTKYVLFCKVGDSLVAVSYNSARELYQENNTIFSRSENWDKPVLLDPTKYVIVCIEESTIHNGLLAEEVSPEEFDMFIPMLREDEEDEENECCESGDGWINITINGLEVKVPPGTTQEDVQNALASASGYEDPTIGWCG